MSLFDKIKGLLKLDQITNPKSNQAPVADNTFPTPKRKLFNFDKLVSTIRRVAKLPNIRPKHTPIPPQEYTEQTPDIKQEKPKDFSKEIEKEIDKNAKDIRKKFYEQSDKQAGKPEDAPFKSDIILQELERRIERWENVLASATEDDYEYYPKKERNFNLKSYLEDQIATYGRARVAYSCENAGKVLITNAEIYVWASEQDQNSIEAAWSMIQTLLSGGEVPSMEERIKVGEDMDIMQDYNPFEE